MSHDHGSKQTAFSRWTKRAVHFEETLVELTFIEFKVIQGFGLLINHCFSPFTLLCA